jgi:hypothetical protein
MTPHEIDELSETFSAHELLASDADVVLTKSREIAQHMRRRQWVLRTTGTVAVTAAVVAGAVTLPGVVGGTPHDTALVQPAAGGGAPAAKPHTTDQELLAFFNAGYVYQDAQQLAQLWHSTGDIAAVKAEAGGKLLDGETLPVAPSGTPATADDLAFQAYFNAGYDYDDALTLGKMWHKSDVSQIKIDAGKKLENGEQLPIQPSADNGKPAAAGGSSAATPPAGDPEAAASEAEAVSAFFQAGYDYNDAVKLAKMWHTTDPYSAKVEGGKKLENGETLPIAR